MEKKFEVKVNGIILRGRCILPEIFNNPLPCVIMMTGDGPKGTKSLSWTNLPPMLLKHKIATILFDFEGIGFSDGERKKLTLTRGIIDFKTIWNEIKRFEWVDFNNIGIFSSSFGSTVALMNTDILNQARVLGFKSPACFLPDAYLNELTKEEQKEWFKNGYSDVNGYDISVLYDCFNYNVYNEISKIKSKCLITHGTSDEVVPISQSYYFFNLLKCEKQIIEFSNGNHGYSVNGDWDKMADIFVSYFKDEIGVLDEK